MKDLYEVIIELCSKSKVHGNNELLSTNYEDQLFEWAENNDIEPLITLVVKHGKHINFNIVRNKPLEYTFHDPLSIELHRQTAFVPMSLFFHACRVKSYSFLICLLLLTYGYPDMESYAIISAKYFPNQQTHPQYGMSEEIISSQRLCYALCQWSRPQVSSITDKEQFVHIIQSLLSIQSSDHYNALHAIAYENNTYLLQFLSTHLPSSYFLTLLNTPTLTNGYTPLCYALSTHDLTISFITLCLSLGCSIDHITAEGFTVLHLFLYTIADYHATHPTPIALQDGSSPMHSPVQRRHSLGNPFSATTRNLEEIRLKILQLLLSHAQMTSMIVNTPDREGNTILHLLTAMGWYDAVKIVMNAGASLTMKNELGETPFLAITFPLPPLPLIPSLSNEKTIEKAATVANTPCYYFYTHTYHSDLIRLYLDRGVDRCGTDSKHGWTILHKLTYTLFRDSYTMYVYKFLYPWLIEDMMKCIDLLLSATVNTNLSSSKSPHSNSNNKHALSILLKKQDIMYGNTILHILVRLNWVEAIELIFRICTNHNYTPVSPPAKRLDSNESNTSRQSIDSVASAASNVIEGLYLKSDGERLLATLLAIRNRYDETPFLSMRFDDTTLYYRILLTFKDNEFNALGVQKIIQTDYQNLMSLFLQCNLMALSDQRIVVTGETIVHRIVRSYPNFQLHSLLEMLLQNGATPLVNSILISTGETALHIACNMSWYEAIQLLLFHNASCTIRNQQGDTPLLSLSFPPMFLPRLHMSNEKRDQNGEGEKTLNLNIDTHKPFNFERKIVNYLDIIKRLTDYGAKCYDERYSVLHKLVAAAKFLMSTKIVQPTSMNNILKGYPISDLTITAAERKIYQELLLSCMEFLMQKQICVIVQQAKFDTRDTPLHIATRNEWLLGIKLLMKYGAGSTLNSRNLHSETPLLTLTFEKENAGHHTHVEETASSSQIIVSSKAAIIQYFVKYSVDVSGTNEHGHNILHKLILSNHTAPTVNNTEQLNCLAILVAYPFSRIIVNQPLPNSGDTPLHLATRDGWFEAVQLLVTQGKSTINLRNYKGETPLLTLRCDRIPSSPNEATTNAIPMARFSAIVHFYIHNGADYSASDDDGKTLLHELVSFPFYSNYSSWSWYEEYLQNITYLCKFGGGKAFVNRLHHATGDTALHIAARNGWFDAMEVLIRYGANVTLTNSDGKLPLLALSFSDCWKKYSNPQAFSAEIQRILSIFQSSRGMDWEGVIDEASGNTFLHHLLLSLPNECYKSTDESSFSILDLFPPDVAHLLPKLLQIPNKFRKNPLTSLLISLAKSKGFGEEDVFCDKNIFIQCLKEKEQLVFNLLDLRANIFCPYQLPNTRCFLSMLCEVTLDTNTEDAEKVKQFLTKSMKNSLPNMPNEAKSSCNYLSVEPMTTKAKEAWKLFLDVSVCTSSILCLNVVQEIFNPFPRSCAASLINSNRDTFFPQQSLSTMHPNVCNYLQSYGYLFDRYEIVPDLDSKFSQESSPDNLILPCIDYGITQEFRRMFESCVEINKPMQQENKRQNSLSPKAVENNFYLEFSQFVGLYEGLVLQYFPILPSNALFGRLDVDNVELFQLFTQYASRRSNNSNLSTKISPVNGQNSALSIPVAENYRLFLKDWVTLCTDLLGSHLQVDIIFYHTEELFSKEMKTFRSLQSLKQKEIQVQMNASDDTKFCYYPDDYYSIHWLFHGKEMSHVELSHASWKFLSQQLELKENKFRYFIVRPKISYQVGSLQEFFTSKNFDVNDELLSIIRKIVEEVGKQLLFLHEKLGQIHGNISIHEIEVLQIIQRQINNSAQASATKIILKYNDQAQEIGDDLNSIENIKKESRELLLLSPSMDIWSLGMVILLSILHVVGKEPPPDTTEGDLQLMMDDVFNQSRDTMSSTDVKKLIDLLQCMLCTNPSERIQSMVDVLHHPFITGEELIEGNDVSNEEDNIVNMEGVGYDHIPTKEVDRVVSTAISLAEEEEEEMEIHIDAIHPAQSNEDEFYDNTLLHNSGTSSSTSSANINTSRDANITTYVDEVEVVVLTPPRSCCSVETVMDEKCLLPIDHNVRAKEEVIGPPASEDNSTTTCEVQPHLITTTIETDVFANQQLPSAALAQDQQIDQVIARQREEDDDKEQQLTSGGIEDICDLFSWLSIFRFCKEVA